MMRAGANTNVVVYLSTGKNAGKLLQGAMSILISHGVWNSIWYVTVGMYTLFHNNLWMRSSSRTSMHYTCLLFAGKNKDPSVANKLRGTTAISYFPMVSPSFGSRSFLDCCTTKNLASSCLSSHSLITLSPTLSSLFFIHVAYVFNLIFFIVSHTDLVPI